MADDARYFGNHEHNLKQTISRMRKEAYYESNCSQDEADRKVRSWMDQDRRFDNFQKDALLTEVKRVSACGGYLDLSKPQLYGRPRRPLDRE